MNITNLIVDYLKQGHVVELPKIGTLSNQRQSAHMDDASHTFHAERNTVSFSTDTNGNNDIVKHLAEVECVDLKIAQLMWNNYIDALTDKLNRTGSHLFPGIGELHLTADNYQFDRVDEPTNNNDGVITNVKRYDTDNTDPFAAFDAPNEEPEPTPEPEPEPTPELASEPVPESVPTPEPEPEPEPEPAPDPEPIVATEPTESDNAINSETDSIANNGHSSETNDDVFANLPKEETVENKKKKKKHGWLWLLLILLVLGAGGYYYYTHDYHNNDTTQNTAETAKDSIQTTNAIAIDSTTIDATIGDSTLSNGETEESSETTNEFSYANMVNIFTFNSDLLEYSENEHIANRNIILNTLQEYWHQYLISQRYINAEAYMQNALTEYIDNRLAELLSQEKYSVMRFFHSEDFLHQFFYDELKSKKASHARVAIQSELMDPTLLNEILRQIVENNNLSPVGGESTPKAKVQKPEHKTDNTSSAHMETRSKKGFDIIAGFYTSRQSAVKMTTRLKSLGCDAYIIDQNHLYYVSMGSASTRTAAEALYKQITSWYDGSVVIKQL